MKKSILFLILIILSQQIKANRDSLYIPQYQNQIQYLSKYEKFFCDACGCAAGNGSSGFESC
jgi:hypothetical protein